MKTLEQIKNDYAYSVGFNDWRELFLTSDKCFESFEYYENQVMKIYAMECLKLAINNKELYPYKGMPLINSEDITNEKNIIK